MAEHVLYFIAMHYSHPFAPEGCARSLRKAKVIIAATRDIQGHPFITEPRLLRGAVPGLFRSAHRAT